MQVSRVYVYNGLHVNIINFVYLANCHMKIISYGFASLLQKDEKLIIKFIWP